MSVNKQFYSNHTERDVTKIGLIILSLLSLMEGSTTTSTPDLLLVVLLFLEHLSALSVVLLKTELGISHSYDDLLWQDDT